MTVGERIKQCRLDLGLSQAELAKRAGYKGKSDISKMENAGDEIGIARITKIADALSVSPAYLMGWSAPVQTIRRIDTVDPLDRVREKAESDPAYKECIIAMLSIRPERQKEIYQFVKFQAEMQELGESSNSQQTA